MPSARRLAPSLLVILSMAAPGCSPRGTGDVAVTTVPELAGAWRSTVQFRSGPFAGVKDLRYEALDPAGRPIPGGGEAEGRAARIRF